MKKPDSLATMLGMQTGFQAHLNHKFFDMSTEERVAYIKEHTIHLSQEINEMLYELPFFKPWKDYSSMSEEQQLIAFAKARCEMIDAWHFFMNIMIGLGFTAAEFTEMYMEKNKENYERQERGYTHDVSYRESAETAFNSISVDGDVPNGTTSAVVDAMQKAAQNRMKG